MQLSSLEVAVAVVVNNQEEMELVFTEVEEVQEVWLLSQTLTFHLDHTQW